MYKSYNSLYYICLLFFLSYFPLFSIQFRVRSITKNGKRYFNENWHTYKAQQVDVSCTRIITLACVFLYF